MAKVLHILAMILQVILKAVLAVKIENLTAALPLDDPFYKAPDGFEKAQLGTILRHRPVTDSIYLLPGIRLRPQSAWQFLYRTQNSVGNPEVSVVTLLKPRNAKPGNLFVLGYFTNAAYGGCNPSFALRALDPIDNVPVHFQTLFAITALDYGYYVSIADDGGPQAGQPTGPQMGHATLDSIRAVLASTNITGINEKPIITMHGFSGAASATGWATELQPHYAPELEIAGTAIGGALIDIAGLLAELNNSWYTVFVVTGILGLSHEYANFSSWLKENFVPEHEAEYRKAESQCLLSNLQYRDTNMDKFYKRGYDSIMDPIPKSIIELAGTMGRRGTPKTPMYIYSNVGDKLSPITKVDKYVENHCNNGGNIYYERNLEPLEHGMVPLYSELASANKPYESMLTEQGFAGPFAWLIDRHNGNPITPGCNAVNISVNGFTSLLKGEPRIYLKALGAIFRAMFGWPI